MSLSIKMDLSSNKTLKSVRRKRKRFQPMMQKALNEIGTETIRIAQENVPVQSGALQRSLDFIVVKVRGAWELLLGSGLSGGERIPYALIQEQGGRTGRNHSVIITPHWYMRNSVRKIRSKATSILKRHLKKALR